MRNPEADAMTFWTVDECLRGVAAMAADPECMPVRLDDHLEAYDLAQTPAERQHEQRLVALSLLPWLMRGHTDMRARPTKIAEWEGASA